MKNQYCFYPNPDVSWAGGCCLQVDFQATTECPVLGMNKCDDDTKACGKVDKYGHSDGTYMCCKSNELWSEHCVNQQANGPCHEDGNCDWRNGYLCLMAWTSSAPTGTQTDRGLCAKADSANLNADGRMPIQSSGRCASNVKPTFFGEGGSGEYGNMTAVGSDYYNSGVLNEGGSGVLNEGGSGA
jgi:hypothetical protein